jgi:hypothetical protein
MGEKQLIARPSPYTKFSAFPVNIVQHFHGAFLFGENSIFFYFFYSSFCVATVTAFDICLAIPEPCSFEKWKCIHNAPRITHCPFYYKLHYLWYE